MLTSIFLAKAFGIYFVIMAAALAINKKAYVHVVEEAWVINYSTLAISVFTLILGILLVLFHNVWVANWRVGITILAWLTLIKGTMLLVYPTYIRSVSSKVFNEKTILFYSLVIGLLGVFFLYKGFY